MRISNSAVNIVLMAALAFCASAAHAGSAGDCLRGIIEEFTAETELKDILKTHIVVGPADAVAVADWREQVAVAYSERMAASIDQSDRRELVEMKAVDLLMRHMASASFAVSNALVAYRYPDLLIQYAGSRLIQGVEGKIAPLAMAPHFLSCEDSEAVFMLLPRESVEVNTVNLVSDKETFVLYGVALFREAKIDIEQKRFDQAAFRLLEARKYGYVNKDLFMDLYKCYLLSEDSASARRIGELLLREYGAQVSFSDCIELARLAEKSGFRMEKNYWYDHAERSIRKGITLDVMPNK